MNKIQASKRLEALDRKVTTLCRIGAVLGWDFETGISPKGGAERAEQLAFLATEAHKIVVSPEMEEAVAALEGGSKGLSDRQRALARIGRKSFRQESKVPEALVADLAKAVGAAEAVWFQARKSNDFEAFRPYLEKVRALTCEKAALIAEDGQTPYDALLDGYEPRLGADGIEALFSEMERTIRKVVDITAGKPVDDGFLYKKYPRKRQEKFDRDIVRRMGFDFQRGMIGESHHPFTTTLGSDDIRFTTRYTEPRVTDTLFSFVHEAGHALYEMGASNHLTAGTSLSNGASMAFHESQSRLWENVLGHSEAFWEFFFPKFRKAYPAQTEGVDLERFVKAVNKVEAGDIRVNADEATYGLHIILRFRLERALFDGSLKVSDLPGAWEDLSLSLLGRRPESLGQGVLQDNHWAGGMFGYFPSYALGNLINAQIMDTMRGELDVDALLREGALGKIKGWLDNRIYRHGAIYESDELLRRVTGGALDESHFDRYLTGKFQRLFG